MGNYVQKDKNPLFFRGIQVIIFSYSKFLTDQNSFGDGCINGLTIIHPQGIGPFRCANQFQMIEIDIGGS